MENLNLEREITGLLVIDPYNDFISEAGKIWDRIRAVAEANECVPHMLQVLNAARKVGLGVFYALHHRYRLGDYETWKYITVWMQYQHLLVKVQGRRCTRRCSPPSWLRRSRAMHAVRRWLPAKSSRSRRAQSVE